MSLHQKRSEDRWWIFSKNIGVLHGTAYIANFGWGKIMKPYETYETLIKTLHLQNAQVRDKPNWKHLETHEDRKHKTFQFSHFLGLV